MAHNTPDIIVIEKKNLRIIDVAIPGEGKEMKKIKIEIKRLWHKLAMAIAVSVAHEIVLRPSY